MVGLHVQEPPDAYIVGCTPEQEDNGEYRLAGACGQYVEQEDQTSEDSEDDKVRQVLWLRGRKKLRHHVVRCRHDKDCGAPLASWHAAAPTHCVARGSLVRGSLGGGLLSRPQRRCRRVKRTGAVWRSAVGALGAMLWALSLLFIQVQDLLPRVVRVVQVQRFGRRPFAQRAAISACAARRVRHDAVRKRTAEGGAEAVTQFRLGASWWALGRSGGAIKCRRALCGGRGGARARV